MIGADVSVDSPDNAGGKMTRGIRKAMRDAADAGFAEAWDSAPVGATSGLKHSGKEPQWRGNTLVWGFTAPYAEDVEFGQPPHLIPIDEMPELELWARRVLGDESAAWGVREKIAEQGTEAQPFVRSGIQKQRRQLLNDGVADKVDDEFRG